jgi:hypothetical protein
MLKKPRFLFMITKYKINSINNNFYKNKNHTHSVQNNANHKLAKKYILTCLYLAQILDKCYLKLNIFVKSK